MKKKIRFTAIVNPFTRTAWISARINKCQYEREVSFIEIDEWNSFEMSGIVFDVHFCYDTEFTLNIYDVPDDDVEYETNYDASYPVHIKYVLKDV